MKYKLFRIKTVSRLYITPRCIKFGGTILSHRRSQCRDVTLHETFTMNLQNTVNRIKIRVSCLIFNVEIKEL